MKKYFKTFFSVLLLFLFLYYLKNNYRDFLVIKKINLIEFLIISIPQVLVFILSATILKIILKHLKTNLTIKEAFSLTMLKRLSAYLITKGGMLLNSIYLKKNHSLDYKKSIALSLYLTVIHLLVISSISLLALIIKKSLFENLFFSLLFFLIAFSSIIILAFPKFIYKIIFIKKFKQAILAWEKYFVHKKLILKILPLGTSVFLLFNLRLYLIYYFLEYKISFLNLIIINATGFISTNFAITPAALGIRELSMATSADLLNSSFNDTLVVVSVDRVITFFWIALLGLYFYYKLMTKKND